MNWKAEQMRKCYYFVKYGPQIRLSEKCVSEQEACKYCFGMVDLNRMSILCVGPRHPKYLSNAKVQELNDQLDVLHKTKIGVEV